MDRSPPQDKAPIAIEVESPFWALTGSNSPFGCNKSRNDSTARWLKAGFTQLTHGKSLKGLTRPVSVGTFQFRVARVTLQFRLFRNLGIVSRK